MKEEAPLVCPRCGSNQIEIDSQSDYTGGGYSDYWEDYYCTNCKHEWRSTPRSDYI